MFCIFFSHSQYSRYFDLLRSCRSASDFHRCRYIRAAHSNRPTRSWRRGHAGRNASGRVLDQSSFFYSDGLRAEQGTIPHCWLRIFLRFQNGIVLDFDITRNSTPHVKITQKTMPIAFAKKDQSPLLCFFARLTNSLWISSWLFFVRNKVGVSWFFMSFQCAVSMIFEEKIPDFWKIDFKVYKKIHSDNVFPTICRIVFPCFSVVLMFKFSHWLWNSFFFWIQELFVERIGYRMLYDVLTTITEPDEQFVEALIELIVESPEKDLSHLVVANPAAAVTVLDYAAVLKSPELQLLIISRVIDLLNKRMHSRIQCASHGMLNAILRLFKSSPQLRPDVADSLVRLFEILAAHSINPGELKELFQLLCKDEDGFQPDYATKLLHSISCIANDTSNKNPFRYFDIQGDHDVSFRKHIQKATFQRWKKSKYFAFSFFFPSLIPASLNHSTIIYHHFNLISFFLIALLDRLIILSSN